MSTDPSPQNTYLASLSLNRFKSTLAVKGLIYFLKIGSNITLSKSLDNIVGGLGRGEKIWFLGPQGMELKEKNTCDLLSREVKYF